MVRLVKGTPVIRMPRKPGASPTSSTFGERSIISWR